MACGVARARGCFARGRARRRLGQPGVRAAAAGAVGGGEAAALERRLVAGSLCAFGAVGAVYAAPLPVVAGMGLEPVAVGAFQGVFSLAGLVACPALERVAAFRGRKSALSATLLVLAAATVVVGLGVASGSVVVLVAARFASGACATLAEMLLISLVEEAAPGRVAVVLARQEFVQGIGCALSAPAAGAAAEVAGGALALPTFAACATLPLAALAVLAPYTRGPRRLARGAARDAGTTPAPDARRERDAAKRSAVVWRPLVVLTAACSVLDIVVWSWIETVVPLALGGRFGLGEAAVGNVLSVAFALYTVLLLCAAQALGRGPNLKSLIAACFVVAAAALVLSAGTPGLATYLTGALSVAAALGFTQALILPDMLASALGGTSLDPRSRRNAVFSITALYTASHLTGAAAAPAIGLWLHACGMLHEVYAGALVLAALALLLASRHESEREPVRTPVERRA